MNSAITTKRTSKRLIFFIACMLKNRFIDARFGSSYHQIEKLETIVTDDEKKISIGELVSKLRINVEKSVQEGIMFFKNEMMKLPKFPTAGTWNQMGKTIDGEAEGDQFGTSISLSADGKIIAVGAPFNNKNGTRSGEVLVFEVKDRKWIQLGDTILSEEGCGRSVSLSADGKTIGVGLPRSNANGAGGGQIRVFKLEQDKWKLVGDPINGGAAGGFLGESVSLSEDGKIVAAGAVYGAESGQILVYENQQGTWTQIGDSINGEAAGELFGHKVSLSADGKIVAAGAPRSNENRGLIRVFKNEQGIWKQIGDSIHGKGDGDRFGVGISLSADGTTVAAGATQNNDNGKGSGHVRVFKNHKGKWKQIGNTIKGNAKNDQLGQSVALSTHGDVVAIVAFGSIHNQDGNDKGQLRVFKNHNDKWIQIGDSIDGDSTFDWFGWSASISAHGDIVAAGEAFSNHKTGQTRIFEFDKMK